jgi:hypothetical protein
VSRGSSGAHQTKFLTQFAELSSSHEQLLQFEHGGAERGGQLDVVLARRRPEQEADQTEADGVLRQQQGEYRE